MDESKKRKAYIGQVISDKMDKTVVLAVTRRIAHVAIRQNHQTHHQVQGP